MAACDNLYGNKKEWKELHDFLAKTNPKWIKLYMKNEPEGDEEERICYIADIQGWLMKNCPLEWVKERLEDNFSIQTLICGKPHHKKRQIK